MARKRTKFKDLKAFKSWREAVDAMQDLMDRRATDDVNVSDRMVEILFNMDLNDFRIRMNFAEEQERRDKRRR